VAVVIGPGVHELKAEMMNAAGKHHMHGTLSQGQRRVDSQFKS
jgi:hypothetical protein